MHALPTLMRYDSDASVARAQETHLHPGKPCVCDRASQK